MDMLIRAKKIIDGTRANPLNNGAIAIEGRTIKEIGPQSEIKAVNGVEVIEADDKTVIPGLIDCHCHFCEGYHSWTHNRYVPREVTKTVLRGVRNAQLCIKAGVLTVRDAGCGHTGIFEMRSAIESGRLLGPRLYVSGQAIAMTGGHGWSSALEVDGPYETRKAVRDMLRWGADCIKFLATGGAATQYEEIDQVQMTYDELEAGVEEARKKKKRTFAHVGNPDGALLCVRAGVDSIDHGTILNNAALNAMKNAGSFYVPTMYVYSGIATKGKDAGLSEWMVGKAKGVLDSHREAFQKAYRMGINIATGTDVGSDGMEKWGGRMGEGLLSEIELMVKYGMTPMDAIRAATQMSARNIGIDQSVGTLERGRLADLVIIDGDPLEDISKLRRVWRVVKEGKLVHEA
jgi:imidazolonepropionase-like amidohydrolase